MLRSICLIACTAFAISGPISAPISAWAQGAPAPAPGASQPAKPPRAAKPPRTARPDREPTAGQMAARERQKKCGAEWREAKVAGKTGGLKWPQYWSQCNARLKGSNV